MGKRITVALFSSIFLAIVFFLPLFTVFAQLGGEVRILDRLFETSRTGDPLFETSRTVGAKLDNPIKFDSLGQLVTAIIDIIIQIAVPLAALFLIYSGYLFVSARGSDDDLKKAKSIFLWTLVGIAVLLGAKLLSGVIEGTIEQIKR